MEGKGGPVTLAVADLLSATPFYFSILVPLGYQFLGEHHDCISFGVTEPDFFLAQSTSGYV